MLTKPRGDDQDLAFLTGHLFQRHLNHGRNRTDPMPTKTGLLPPLCHRQRGHGKCTVLLDGEGFDTGINLEPLAVVNNKI